jgi:phosphatidate cytidylyltransferase
MALNKEVFKTRAITAIIFALVMLAGLFINEWTFLTLFTIIHFGCWIEFVRILKKIYGNKFLPYSLLGLIYITLPILAMLSMGFNIYPGKKLFIPGLHFEGVSFRVIVFSTILPIAVILSIWINDTMAYIVGSLIGKTPFSKISPKKTWEGTAGGVILCIVVMGLLGNSIFVLQRLELKHWLCIAAIASISGTLGDLLESKLKRSAGIKDSGSFMPGHGGFLDRFDSLLLATPMVWVYVYFWVV